jgi:hypothetical protein
MENKNNIERGAVSAGLIGAVAGIAIVAATGGLGALGYAAGIGGVSMTTAAAGFAAYSGAAVVGGGLIAGAAGYGIGSLFDSNGNPIDPNKTTCDPSKEDCSGGSAPGEEAAQEADPTNNPEYCLAVVQHLSAISNATVGVDEELKKTQKELDIARLALDRAKGASTATSTADTTTTTSTSTLANLAPLAVSVSPNVLHIGDSATFYVTINNSITSYSLDLYKDGQLAGTLAGNQTVLGSARPVTLKFPFSVTAGTPMSSFEVRAYSYSNPTIYATTSFLVVPGNTPLVNQYGATPNNTATQVSAQSVSFSNPFSYQKVKRNSNITVSWTYKGNPAGTMNVFVSAKCVKKVNICTSYNISNPTKACTVIKSSCKTGATVKIPIATNVRISNQSMKWKVPSKIVDKQAVIYAEQNGKKIGTGQSFYVSY